MNMLSGELFIVGVASWKSGVLMLGGDTRCNSIGFRKYCIFISIILSLIAGSSDVN